MFLCSDRHNPSRIYLFTDADDTSPYSFNSAYGYPRSTEVETVQIVDEDSPDRDDEGEPIEQECYDVDVYKIPTNAYKLIQFRDEYQQKKFLRTIERFYSKEII